MLNLRVRFYSIIELDILIVCDEKMLFMWLWSVIRQLSSSRSIKETLSVDDVDVDTFCVVKLFPDMIR